MGCRFKLGQEIQGSERTSVPVGLQHMVRRVVSYTQCLHALMVLILHPSPCHSTVSLTREAN